MPNEKILIFADGASKGNPGPGGWGALIAADGMVRELGGREEHTTNNRMELTAAAEALEHVKKIGVRAPAVLHTDSSYVINGITKWVPGWQKGGWMTKDKKPVLNRDLWERLARAVGSLGVSLAWEHVGGHVGVTGNERVDEIASNFAEGKPNTLYNGRREQYALAIENISHDATRVHERAQTKTRSNQKAYSYVSAVDGAVMVHATWAECEARVRGKRARFRKALSAEDEARIIAEFSK